MAVPSTLHPGTQLRAIAESASNSGSRSAEFIIQSDAVLVSVWCDSIASSQTLTIRVYTLTESGKELEIITFDPITSSTSVLVTGVSQQVLQRIRITATYTGACSYEVYARAVYAAGTSGGGGSGTTSYQFTVLDELLVEDDSEFIIYATAPQLIIASTTLGNHRMLVTDSALVEIQ